MSSSDFVISVEGLGKRFEMYERPAQRLLQPIYNRLRRLIGLPPVCLYREHWGLRNVSFGVRQGETVGIIGCNGSGKSTLLQIICGTLAPTAGKVEVRGRIAALLELGAGFNPDFTGRENVYMAGAILGLSQGQVAERFDSIEKFADIGDFIDQPVGIYSSGMFVRLAFAVVANADADVLVIDEALAVGDIFFIQKCMRFLRKFQETGTVLFVSHDSGAVVNLCDRAVWLDHGSLREVGQAHRVCEHYLASRYEGSDGVSIAAVDGEGPLNDGVSRRVPQDSAVVAAALQIPARDMRQDFINTTTLRNDLEIFRFGMSDRCFGTGQCSVLDAHLEDSAGNQLNWLLGGEEVVMLVRVAAHVLVSKIIVGFFFKDRLGQVLFGDNTYLSYCDAPMSLPAGEELTASFHFRMPILPKGGYTVDVAVADGTHDDHVQLQWVHDAFAVESHSSSSATGLIGIPFSSIELRSRNRAQVP